MMNERNEHKALVTQEEWDVIVEKKGIAWANQRCRLVLKEENTEN
jgi:hypothetical protein